MAGEDTGVVYRAGVNEVQLTFSARDQNQHGAATLQVGDFAVVDTDRVIRKYRSFRRVNLTRIDVAVLIDASESVKPDFRSEIMNTLELISQIKDIPQKSISVFFARGSKPAVLCSGACTVSSTTEQLSQIRPAGLTPLFDSVVFVSDFLSGGSVPRDENLDGSPAARRVLVIFSDGEDNVSIHSYTDALQTALAGDVEIYSVDTGDPTFSDGAEVLRNLATATGGRFLATKQSAYRLAEAILEDFHSTYSVTYSLPSRAEGFHPVRILPTNNSRIQFRCRSGYYYFNLFSPSPAGN